SDFNKIHREKYDLVLTQYILDILEDREIHALFYAINQRTDGDSKWIFLDFFRVKGKKILLDVMILFFRFLTQNPRKDLPDYGQFFLQYNWGIEEKLSLKKGFIQAWVLGRREIGTEELRDGERKGRRDLETKGLRNGETKGRRD